MQKVQNFLRQNFQNFPGLLQINLTTQELTIKPGELFKIENTKFEELEKTNGFIKPGEIIVENIIAQKLSYVEFIKINSVEYVLVRPVQRYRYHVKKVLF